ncbi:unnamed protein product [Phaedon cochleariae]|uniref:Outer dynein arm-docking complex subunit 4 n=1 Tax=Phaedon cochleariae TaxID=80249 RepID=A0A9P0DT99_PHACE|nr:unnamed protein product [Phaedon cochleariae]
MDTMADSTKAFAETRLRTTREAELLQSFVRITVDDHDIKLEEKEADKEDVKKVEEPSTEAKGKQTIPLETSKRLSRELQDDAKKKKKKRRRRFGPKYEEVYCDKDRAAAVDLGTKDIKQSLRIKRKEDRSKMLQIPDEAEPGNFLALGNYEMCRGDLRNAIVFISKALELNPTEKNALVARSKCYILLGQPKNALQDAELALQIDKNFIKAIYQKAEALYYLGDFELSLMYCHRGLHVRPDHEGFKLGVHKAQKAIENAIGSISTTKKNKRKEQGPAVGKVTGGDDNIQSPASKTSNKTTPSGSSRSKSSRKSRLLRELETDKEYLDKLMNNPNIRCKFTENNDTIETCIKETVEYLNERQEFWRQQLPAHLK